VRASRTPSNDRDWVVDQSVLPLAEIHDGSVTIRNIRNFRYASTTEFTPAWYDRTFDLDDVVSVDFIVEPFGTVGAAHTFLSFGLANGERIAFSAEIRREKGEEFDPLKGVLNRYEIMYVVADERDVVLLRVIHRKHAVYAYPTTATAGQARALLLGMLERINALAREPEFYNTVTNNCAVTIARHVNALHGRRVPWNWRLLFPAESDAYAYELGFIDPALPLAEARLKYRLPEDIGKFADDPGFSSEIRAAR
jgi:hypothetical protein